MKGINVKYIYYTKSVFINESGAAVDEVINAEVAKPDVELFSTLSIGAAVLLMFRKQVIEEPSIKPKRASKNG